MLIGVAVAELMAALLSFCVGFGVAVGCRLTERYVRQHGFSKTSSQRTSPSAVLSDALCLPNNKRTFNSEKVMPTIVDS